MNNRIYYSFLLCFIFCNAAEIEFDTISTNYHQQDQIADNDFTRTIFSETRTTDPDVYHTSLKNLARKQYIRKTGLGHVAVMHLATCEQGLARTIETDNQKFNSYYGELQIRKGSEFCNALFSQDNSVLKAHIKQNQSVAQRVILTWMGTCIYPDEPFYFTNLANELLWPKKGFLESDETLALRYAQIAMHLDAMPIAMRNQHKEALDEWRKQRIAHFEGICELHE